MTEVPDPNGQPRDPNHQPDNPEHEQATNFFDQTTQVADLEHEILAVLVGQDAIVDNLDKIEIDLGAILALSDEELEQDADLRASHSIDEAEMALIKADAKLTLQAGLAAGLIEGFWVFNVDSGMVTLQKYTYSLGGEYPVYDQTIHYQVVGQKVEVNSRSSQVTTPDQPEPPIPAIPVEAVSDQLERITAYLQELSALPMDEIRARLGLSA